ncbi:MAG: hypothetical protein VX773_01135 [Pseudomonadota bacterium]|nr:hypothetical protein [Pseudomonadota bacterium]
MDEKTLSDFLYTATDELRSYSDSFESRARDRFVTFVKELKELGSHDEYRTMLHADRVILEKKSRRLLDYIEVSAFMDRIEIISLNQEVTQQLIEILKSAKGFETVNHDPAASKVTVPLPPLSMNAMLELKSTAIAKQQQLEKALFGVKSQTGQQIRAGIEREYIFQPDAAKVSKEIDQIIEHYLTYSKIFSIAKQELVMGSFKAKTPEEEELYTQIGPAKALLEATASN